MTDRRRINGPPGATSPPVYETTSPISTLRARPANGIRGLFLKAGVTPTASGSAYMEIEPPYGQVNSKSKANGMKLICTVHGPRSLPRSAPFSPYLVLSTHVKYAPFATRQRRSYLRDSSERDLSVHLDTALRGVIIADRWPKSGVDVIVTIIEGDQEREASHFQGNEEWDTMNVLSGCVTVAAAALADAGIDCVDMVTGGVAAIIASDKGDTATPCIVLDPVSLEHEKIMAACCVAYLPNRAEITNLWAVPFKHLRATIGRFLKNSKTTSHLTARLSELERLDGVAHILGRELSSTGLALRRRASHRSRAAETRGHSVCHDMLWRIEIMGLREYWEKGMHNGGTENKAHELRKAT